MAENLEVRSTARRVVDRCCLCCQISPAAPLPFVQSAFPASQCRYGGIGYGPRPCIPGRQGGDPNALAGAGMTRVRRLPINESVATERRCVLRRRVAVKMLMTPPSLVLQRGTVSFVYRSGASQHSILRPSLSGPRGLLRTDYLVARRDRRTQTLRRHDL